MAFCGECGQECEAIVTDESVDERPRWGVESDCCGAEPFHDVELTDPYTTGDAVGDQAEREAESQVAMAEMEEARGKT